MSKSTVTRLFVVAIALVAAGVVLELVAVWVALAGGVVVLGGPAVVELAGGPNTWLVVALAVTGFLTITAGWLVGVVSWIGALVNTAQLEDKTWFAVLLVLGVFSFGFVAMIAYVIAGPDGTRQRVTSPTMAAAVHG